MALLRPIVSKKLQNRVRQYANVYDNNIFMHKPTCIHVSLKIIYAYCRPMIYVFSISVSNNLPDSVFNSKALLNSIFILGATGL